MGRGSASDYRRLQSMTKDLQHMQHELAGERDLETLKAKQAELAVMGGFERQKREVNQKLSEIRQDVGRLTEMRSHLEAGGRNEFTIRLSHENNLHLKQAAEMLLELKRIHEKDEAKNRFSPKDLADHRQMILLIGREIVSLTTENSQVKLAESKEEYEMRQRVEERKRAEAAKIRAKRAARQHGSSKKDKASLAIDAIEFTDLTPQTESELAFQDRVDRNIAEQNVVLGEIETVLDDILHISHDINRELKIEGAMIADTEEVMDDALGKFAGANKRLKNILKESGGVCSWMVKIILGIVLLALGGLIIAII